MQISKISIFRFDLGFYIYRQLAQVNGDLRYYGLPNALADDGLTSDGTFCQVGKDENCTPMEKTFYLQYQWFPFYVASMGFLFYLPYIVFRYINTDLISLKGSITAVQVDIDSVIKNYFNYQINPPLRMRLRIIANIGVKICYLVVNIVAFVVTDSLLNGDFRRYGSEWIAWSRLSNEKAYDYTRSRHLIKPGEKLLPTFGICDVLNLGKDVKHELSNKHRFVCEISQNVLYQYVLMLLWFLYIIGMVVSSVGLIMKIIEHIVTTASFLLQGSQAKKVYQSLTLRECEYLEYVRKKKMLVYGKLIRKLKEERLDIYGDNYERGNGVQDHMKSPYNPSRQLLDENAKL